MIREVSGREGLSARVIDIPGARNLRELGGYPAQDGRRIRGGMVYRGGHPGGITEQHMPLLTGLGLNAIVDLRTTEERAELPFPPVLTGTVSYWKRDYTLSRGDVVRILRDPATLPGDMRSYMIESYRRYPQEQHDGIAAVLRTAIDCGGPMLVNCTAGKDRTGVACAILLAALGVDYEVIRQDYALTEQLHDPSGQLFAVDPDGPFAYLLSVSPAVWHTMMRSDAAYIDATFAGIEDQHGSTDTYLRDVHGLNKADLERLRDCLLEI